MKLLGERNWYLPRALEWLPRVGLEGTSASAAGAPGANGDAPSDGQGRARPTRPAPDGEAARA
jgi:hypothetical protein